MGDRTMGVDQIRALVSAGYAVAALDYRLSGEAGFPAAVQDVKAAVRFLRANATRYGLDPRRYGAFGGSAGGYLAVMLGVTAPARGLTTRKLGNPGESRRGAGRGVLVRADQLPHDGRSASRQSGLPLTVHARRRSGFPGVALAGGADPDDPETARAASPLSYIDAATNLSPFHLEAGDEDCLFPGSSPANSPAPTAKGATVTHLVVPGAGQSGVSRHLGRCRASFASSRRAQAWTRPLRR